MQVWYLVIKKNIFPILVVLFTFPFYRIAYGETSKETLWRSLETKYTLIHYQHLEDLKRFNNKLNYGPEKWGFKRLFSKEESDKLLDVVGKKVDMIFERVQEILDMRKMMPSVTINIYRDQKQLYDAYFEIYKQSCQLRAWYIFEYNTIYFSIEDLHEGMLAHEMAHSIIDHYLTVRPPVASAEILARYVDSHLK